MVARLRACAQQCRWYASVSLSLALAFGLLLARSLSVSASVSVSACLAICLSACLSLALSLSPSSLSLSLALSRARPPPPPPPPPPTSNVGGMDLPLAQRSPIFHSHLIKILRLLTIHRTRSFDKERYAPEQVPGGDRSACTALQRVSLSLALSILFRFSDSDFRDRPNARSLQSRPIGYAHVYEQTNARASEAGRFES